MYNAKILGVLQGFPKKHDKKQPKGIIFIFGMSAEVTGVNKDVEKVTETFEDHLQFACYDVGVTTCSELVNLIIAAVAYKYPRLCKHKCFYFSGHGGIDKNQRPYFKAVTSIEAEVVLIREDILCQFQHTSPNDKFILFFDCCLSENNSDNKVLPYKLFEAPPRCFIAYAAQKGYKAYGDKVNGGRWTASLCKHIKEPIGLGEVLGRVNEDLTNQKDIPDLCPPCFESNIGCVDLVKGNFFLKSIFDRCIDSCYRLQVGSDYIHLIMIMITAQVENRD